LVNELEAEFLKIRPENVVAFVAEPVVGATSGCVASPKGYFPAVRKLCDKYGVMLMLDEIMCGMGRTSTYFAFEQDNVVPDIVTIGKGLGGGYAPVAAVLILKDCEYSETGKFCFQLWPYLSSAFGFLCDSSSSAEDCPSRKVGGEMCSYGQSFGSFGEEGFQ